MSNSIVQWFVAVATAFPFPLIAQESGFVDSPAKAAPVREEDGKSLDAAGNPTFKIGPDGTVDWYTFSGYRRYHSACHTCHGPDGLGSSYAPALLESLKRLDYPNFIAIVAQGRTSTVGGRQVVMPAFGDNKNVYCYMDDLYVYLRARAVADLPRGRPAKKAAKPTSAAEYEEQCMSG